ncbi:MAG: 50S ribosomal protein L22 [Acidimicrobiales bacterium]
MAFGVKTNELPGTRAVVRYARFSAFKARPVLDEIRGRSVGEADEILQFTARAAAVVIRKCLASAVANAQHNDELDPDELYVAACYADEGPTLRRWRPRARGRATRIRKRTCHVTVIISRMPDEMLERYRQQQDRVAATGRGRRGRDAAEARRERVRRSRQQDAAAADEAESAADDEDLLEAGELEEAEVDEPKAEEPEVEAEAEESDEPDDEADESEAKAAEADAGAADDVPPIAEGGAGEAEGRAAPKSNNNSVEAAPESRRAPGGEGQN